jgi:hypothetical protein
MVKAPLLMIQSEELKGFTAKVNVEDTPGKIVKEEQLLLAKVTEFESMPLTDT